MNIKGTWYLEILNKYNSSGTTYTHGYFVLKSKIKLSIVYCLYFSTNTAHSSLHTLVRTGQFYPFSMTVLQDYSNIDLTNPDDHEETLYLHFYAFLLISV